MTTSQRATAITVAAAVFAVGLATGTAITARSTTTKLVTVPPATVTTLTPGRAEAAPIPKAYIVYGANHRAVANFDIPPTTLAGQHVIAFSGENYPPPVPTTTPTTVPTTTSTQPAATTSSSSGPPSGLAFDDEMNGTSIDTTKWTANWLGNPGAITKPSNGSMTNCQNPADVSESGGAMHLRIRHISCTAVNGTTYPWSAGLATTSGKFTFTTGTLTARIFLPGTTRILNWPGLWTDGTGTWPATGESDIIEGLGGNACWHYHSNSGGPGGCVGALTGWHIFSETIAKGQVQYAYDGQNVGSPLPVVNAPHYLILQEATGGESGGDAEGEMLIDYLRVSTP